MNSVVRRTRNIGLTLLVGVAGGGAALALNSPLPWLLGPIVTVACFQLFGQQAEAPKLLRQTGQLVLGVVIGSYFSPSVASQLASYLGVMLLVALSSIVASGLLGLLIARFTDVDRTTAYFASMPGGVSEMSVLAERYGGNIGLVALAQSLRLVLVVFTIPIVLTVVSERQDAQLADTLISPLYLPWLLAQFGSGLLFSIGLQRMHVMNSWFLGGLFAGGAAAFLGWDVSAVPGPVLAMGQVFIGAALGARFEREILVRLRRFVPVMVMGTMALIIFNVILAAALHMAWLLEFPTLLLSTAPGGVAEMSITAEALGINVPAVTAFHLVRIFLIVGLSSPLYRLACIAGQFHDRT